MEPLQVSKIKPLETEYVVNYYRVLFTLFGFAYLFSFYFSLPSTTPLHQFLVPGSAFALLPLTLAGITYFIKSTRDYIRDIGSAFFMISSLYLIGFLAFNGFQTHYEIGIITLVLISNLHLNKVLYIVLYNVIVLTALEFVFITASPNSNIQPVLFFIFLLLVMLVCIYFQLYRIRFLARKTDSEQLMTGQISGNPDAWMLFEAPGLVAKDAGANALQLFSIASAESLDQVSLRTLIAAGTAVESDNIIKNILSGTITGLKTQCRKLTGELFWADIASFRIAGRPNIIYCRFLDISENTHSQEDANENAIRFRRYLDTISEGLIVSSTDGVIRMVNKTAFEMMEADKVLLKAGNNIKALLNAAVTNAVFPPENNFHALNGLSKLIPDAFTSSHGKLTVSVSTVHDIITNENELLFKIRHADKQITLPLAETQPLLAPVYETGSDELFLSTPLPVAVTSAEGIIIKSNLAFTNLTGYSVQELKKLKPENLLHPEDIIRFRNFQKVTGSYNPALITIRLINKYGTALVVNCSQTILHLSGELNTIYLLNDITGYKNTEAALQQAGSNVTAVIENTDAPIFSVDFNHRITVMNSAFLSETFKRTGKKAAAGDDIRTLLEKDKKLSWEHLFRQVIKGNKTVGDETETYTDGSVDFFEVSCFPIVSSKQLVIGVSVLYRKVTDQMRIEEELMKAKEIAEAATLAKSDFLATMSHEIRTPLNGVLGITGLLTTTTLNPEQLEYVNAIRLSGEALLSVINDVLDYSKIESGKMELDNRPFEIASCVKETFDMMRYKAMEKGNVLSYKLDEKLPAFVSGDKARLRQILVNLVGNAIKFTDKGAIDINVKQQNRTGNNIEILFEIKDTGIGMNKEQVSRLFQSFSQADTSTYGKYGGSGLGLTISQRMAELMHGKIEVESEAGKGSKFYFTITAGIAQSGISDTIYEKEIQPAEFLKDKDVASRFPLRILIAEDNEVNRMVAQKSFQQLGYDPEIVANGKLAVEKFHSTGFDIIFMDVQMPELNGFEATTEIRNSKGKKQPLIVAMTALALEGDREKCIAAGMDDYLAKPVAAELLKKIIINHGSKHSQKIALSNYTDAQLVDTNVVNRLIDMAEDDSTFLQKLVEIFMKQSEEIISVLEKSASEINFESTYQAAHKLKGSSLNLGAKVLSEVCKNIEEACMKKDAAVLSIQAEQIRKIYNATAVIYKKLTGIK